MKSIFKMGLALLLMAVTSVVAIPAAISGVVHTTVASLAHYAKERAYDLLTMVMARTGAVLYMGAATGRDLHIDQVLSQMAMGYRPEGFIADMIFPTVPVGKQSDLYMVFSRSDRMRQEDDTRAPGTRARRVTEDVGSGLYFAKNYALAAPAVLEDKANADPMQLAGIYNSKATFLLDKMLINWERRVALQVTSGSNVGSSSAVSSGWEGSGASPLTDLNNAIDNVYDSNGVRPNRIVMGLDAWRSFRRNADVRGLIFGTNNGGGYPNVQQAAALLDVDQIFIGGGFYNSSQEGQSESLAKIWGDQVLVYYAPDAPSKEKPSFGYNFRWAAPGLPNMQVERHPYDSQTKSEDIEVGYYQDEKITGASYGFLLKSVNSST